MKNDMLIYVSKDGNVKVGVNILEDDIWMSLDVMANLYDTKKHDISYHLANIFEEGELNKNSVVKDFLTTASDGKKYNVLHYNLDVIIAVGYRINSKKATEFRIWATKVLKEYMFMRFTLQDKSPEISSKKDAIVNFNDNFKTFTPMVKMYGNKKVKFELFFNEDGDDLEAILSKAFKGELNKQIFEKNTYYKSKF